MPSNTPARVTASETSAIAAVKNALIATHPWYDLMARPKGPWMTMRAILEGFQDDGLKRAYLPKGKFEPKQHYNVRIELTQFLGETPTIADSLAGSVFAARPDIRFSEKAETEKESASEKELREWADNVDGRGTAIVEALEGQCAEAIAMGMSIFLMDGSKMPSPEETQRRIGKPRPTTRADDLALGMKFPRLVPFAVEQLTNWGEDDMGRPAWAILAHEVSRQNSPLGSRESVVEFIVMDTTKFATFEAPVENVISYPLTASMIGNPRLVIPPTDHGLGVLPIVPMYGGGKVFGPFKALTLLAGSARADIAAFNEDSWATFARYVHNVPLLKIKSRRDLDVVYRDQSHAFKLDPNEQEDVDYAVTPSEGFKVSLEAIQSRRLDAYRKAGADPTGMFEEGSASPESGKAKSIRFQTTESRALTRVASHTADAAFSVIDLAARFLADQKPAPDEMAFNGSTRFPQRFDGADPTEVIEQFDKTQDWIPSETWKRGQLKRIAMLTRGEVSQEEQQKIEAEIDAGELPPTSMERTEMEAEIAAKNRPTPAVGFGKS